MLCVVHGAQCNLPFGPFKGRLTLFLCFVQTKHENRLNKGLRRAKAFKFYDYMFDFLRVFYQKPEKG